MSKYKISVHSIETKRDLGDFYVEAKSTPEAHAAASKRITAPFLDLNGGSITVKTDDVSVNFVIHQPVGEPRIVTASD